MGFVHATSSNVRQSVWVVEDSPLDATRARSALSDPYTVEVFPDANAMIERLATDRPPEALVLDWLLPGLSGLDVCRFLRAQPPPIRDIGILMVTVHKDPHQVAEALTAGANDFVSKPYSAVELRARVSAMVRSHQLLRRAERAEAEVRRLLAEAPDPLITVDAQGMVVFLNTAAERLVGASGVQPLGRPLPELLPGLVESNIGVGDREPLLPLQDVSIGDQLYAPRVRVLYEGDATRTTISLRNVTDQRLREARRLDLYSVVAHDLRTPLGTMLLRIRNILDGGRGLVSAELLSDLRKMSGNIRDMVGMINDFLELARFDGTAWRMERTHFELAPVVRSLTADFEPLAHAGGVAFTLDMPTDCPPLLGDPRRIGQALSNLVSNAFKYTPVGGRIELRVASGRDYVEVSVEDTGQGIPPEALPRVFERYVSDESGTSAGFGLGLMIVRQIVEAHGGTVGVESQVGRGSRFWFRLPPSHPHA